MDPPLISPSPILPLTRQCLHYATIGQVPWDTQKYWHQRYSIFSLYDEADIRMTDDAWFGVTPEPVAQQIAYDLSLRHPHEDSPSTPQKRKILIDLFAGAGGNTIAFALSAHWDAIIAVERDAATLACAQHNASAYGVPDGAVTWVHADIFDLLARLKGNPGALAEELRVADEEVVLFASPPWGGISYRDQDVFDLSTMRPYNLQMLHEACAPLEHALYLPRTSDLRQLAALVPGDGGKKMDVVQYCMEGASKAMVAYVPARKKEGD